MGNLPSTPNPTDRARDLLDEHLPMLRVYTRHLVAGATDADDIAQDVCVEVLAQPGILLRGDDPGAYLRGIARHLSSRHRRRFPRHRALEELIELAWDEVAAEPSDTGTLNRCLEGLTGRMRTLLDLRYRDGLNATEIGTRMTMTADAVRMALLRSRQALAQCLDRQETQHGR
jgi:RNA polymerase sigma-70 factor (ECF subfamily)